MIGTLILASALSLTPALSRLERSASLGLGHPRWATREATERLLRDRGRDALGGMIRAARSPDPERSHRGRRLIQGLRFEPVEIDWVGRAAGPEIDP